MTSVLTLSVFLSIVFGLLIVVGAVLMAFGTFKKPDAAGAMKFSWGGTLTIVAGFLTILIGIIGMSYRFDEKAFPNAAFIANEPINLGVSGSKLTWDWPENMTVTPLWVAIKIEKDGGTFYTDVIPGSKREYNSEQLKTGVSVTVWYGSANGPSAPATFPVKPATAAPATAVSAATPSAPVMLHSVVLPSVPTKAKK